jgi:hypothetical protein
MAYRFRITVEPLGETGGQPLVFEAANHDDILAIVERMGTKLALGRDTIASLGVGLKLVSAVANEQRSNPMFAQLRTALRDVTMQLKQMPVAGASEEKVGRLL